ncbi:hypothetical protein PHYBOEH_009249 [Phytophthora boehmeriae]|uniref:RxLR effector protein n=1 Tax=Phytophthora boehmeriae TaxID=109152 RepID=A0A8T1VUD1_9STRA|nr:hypothetical protein PHYBOEH_009249 [Phytophthora boehmeriae]
MRLRNLVLMIAALSSFDVTSVVTASPSTTSVATSPTLTRSVAAEYDGGANQRSLRTVKTIDKDDEERASIKAYKESLWFKHLFQKWVAPSYVGNRRYFKYYLQQILELHKKQASRKRLSN